MNEIIRICPDCRGELKVLRTASDVAFDKYGIHDFLIIWNAYLDGNPFRKRIEDYIYNGNSSQEINLQSDIRNAYTSVRQCDKCKHVWDIFDETDFVLRSNDKSLIHNYISLIEGFPIFQYWWKIRITIVKNTEPQKKETDWITNLIKARLYQYQYKNQSDSQRNDDYDYKHLYDIALQNAEKYHTDNENLLSYEYELRADMSDDILERFNLLNAALTSNICTHRKVRIQNNINELYSTVLDRWKQPISIEKRRTIFIANNLDDIAGYYDPTKSINHFFTIGRIPASIKFPNGLPQTSTLYIANPARTDEYIPYDNCEELLFMDKIRELRRLLRFMGATEITFTTVKGKSTEEFQKEVQSTSVSGSVLSHKASVGSRFEKQQEQTNSRELKVNFIERLDPCDYPSIPENLHWFYSEPEWQYNVEARLHSNQLDFKQEISTKQISSLSEMSQLDVDAAYKNLILKIKAKHHHEQEFHKVTREETMWRITAKFKPLSEFENSDNTMHLNTGIQQNLSSDEKVYLEAVGEYLEDGSISERDRRMLERLRKSLGFSEEQAYALEATLVSQLTDNEKDYLEALKECLEEGGINDRDRRTLERLRKSLDISEERARELEAMA